MVVEPESLCWVTGRMVQARDGVTWAEEFARLPALTAVVRDDGTGLGKGVIPNRLDDLSLGDLLLPGRSPMANARLPVVPHLSPDEIARRYRACRTGVEKTHWQALWPLTRPDRPASPAQAAAAVGLSAVWVRALLKRWNAEGPDGLAHRRKGTNGGRTKLSADRQID
ncbi:MAG: helix-turn-helix domain-containing protein, partial [Planctomycetaceae bacterium]|nr:helix-turn-helix domain-containing protein [Planctomycetaceae bacterium]